MYTVAEKYADQPQAVVAIFAGKQDALDFAELLSKRSPAILVVHPYIEGDFDILRSVSKL